jgi:GH24 family phage-related lysozyme (muramidase)
MLLNWSFIEELEGFRATGYVPVDRNGKPLGRSGVTIGYGVDLGHWSAAQLRRQEVPTALIQLLRPYLGLRGEAALAVASRLELDEDDARTLSRLIQRPIVNALRRRYGGSQRAGTLRWDYLPAAARTVMVSVAFQYGPFLSRRTPKFWRTAVTNDWAAMVAELRDFGDLYPTRRGKEADHLSHILK